MSNQLPPLTTCTIAVIGLGYVGLPLAVEFAKVKQCVHSATSLNRRVIGFEINQQRLSELSALHDSTLEVSAAELQSGTGLEFTADQAQLVQADVFVVTVPTPIDSANRPDLTPLKKASATLGLALKARAQSGSSTLPVVIYESTVYPGATEEVCVPILERESGLRFNIDFFCGYSPERINPGDTEHKLTTIVKVTSGSSAAAADWVDALYRSIIFAGTHRAASIKVAEAAKVIENTQRDLNIALVNELAIIFYHMGIDSLDVLEAAGTKWNFLPFRPGLVGGHCIGVDPYYLTFKAQELGYLPQLVLAGRRINDGMGSWLVEQLVLKLSRSGQTIAGARVLVLGISFKENCPDLRNTKVVDLIRGLETYGMEVEVVDPWVDPEEAWREYGLSIQSTIPASTRYAVVIAAVAHEGFVEIQEAVWRELILPKGILYDLKGVIPRTLDPIRL